MAKIAHQAPPTNSLRDAYRTTMVPALQAQLQLKNVMAVPRPLKLTYNVGLGKAKDDERLIQVAVSTLQRISGQKPVLTKARKSISAFKIREGMDVGAMVTLRGQRMWDALYKLVAVVLPRVRDFHGISRQAIDRQGNMTLGFREHLVFPEIAADEVEKIHGIEVTVTTTARTADQAYALLKALGFPFTD